MAYTVNPVSHVGHLSGAATPVANQPTRAAAQNSVTLQHPLGVGGIGRTGMQMHTDQPGGSSKQMSVQSGLNIATHSPVYAGRGVNLKGSAPMASTNAATTGPQGAWTTQGHVRPVNDIKGKAS